MHRSTSSEHLSNISRTSIEHLSGLDRTPIVHLSHICQTSAEHLSNICPSWIEPPSSSHHKHIALLLNVGWAEFKPHLRGSLGHGPNQHKRAVPRRGQTGAKSLTQHRHAGPSANSGSVDTVPEPSGCTPWQHAGAWWGQKSRNVENVSVLPQTF